MADEKHKKYETNILKYGTELKNLLDKVFMLK